MSDDAPKPLTDVEERRLSALLALPPASLDEFQRAELSRLLQKDGAWRRAREPEALR